MLGNMYELGAEEKKLHAELASSVLESGAELFISVGDLAREAGLRLETEGFAAENIFNCFDTRAAAELISRHSAEGDMILLKGSRRNKMEQIADIMEKDYAEVKR